MMVFKQTGAGPAPCLRTRRMSRPGRASGALLLDLLLMARECDDSPRQHLHRACPLPPHPFAACCPLLACALPSMFTARRLIGPRALPGAFVPALCRLYSSAVRAPESGIQDPHQRSKSYL